ncbi:circadian clock-controlled protein daywake-like [Vanessa tameamea]|uniref:Circadian clock-controlled protein daywake-like n=1 Tax=Vanessa tameamea TaxID=334116 RepID=A0A8B8INJ2_VANTA|nr:circadian clock-controlled protein-like [Vanessa tameamea]
MFSLRFILFACLSLVFSEAYVINYTPCSIKDKDCMIDLFQKVIHDHGENGIAEINLPALDPMKLANISIKVLDEIVILIKEGVVKGFKNCKVNSFDIDLEKQLANPEIACEVLTIKGHFLIEGSSPLLQSLFGTTSIKGEGKTKIKLDKVTMKIEIPVTVIKKEDGQTYFKVLNNKPKYTYDIKKLTFDAKNLVIGKNDLSQIVTTYVNDNWKTLLNTYGKEIVNKAIVILFEYINKFYDNIGAEQLIKEDLTPYIKN